MLWCVPKVKPYPDCNFIKLEELQRHKTIPKYSNCKLVKLNKIDFENSLLVFVSHAWMEEDAPDNEQNEKWQLIVEGISKILKSMTQASSCYVWLDYCCLKGDEKTKDSFPLLFYNVIMHCDCMITPIVDHLADHWELIHSPSGYYRDYKASRWNGGIDGSDSFGYLNRAWCRIEAFYCSNLPLVGEANSQSGSNYSKITRLEGVFKRLVSYGHRPHFLYGSREKMLNLLPLNLPQLQNTYLEEYHPMRGQVRQEMDSNIIEKLFQELELKHGAAMELGYTGELDHDGHQNGKGRYLSHKQDVYYGMFVNNKRNGHGVLYSPNGDRYEGNWENNQKAGKGTMHYICGDVYVGDWKDDLQHGSGIMSYAFGEFLEYDGEWANGKKDGHGKLLYRNGSDIVEIIGSWCKNQTKGKAQIKYANGSSYDGETKDAKKHGKGTFICSLGKYKGDFRNDVYHGRGHMDYANGDIFNGEWSDGVIDGRGSLICDGEEYDGYFRGGQKCGQGKMVYKDGTMYVGEWKDNKRNGSGKSISADETQVIQGIWEDDKKIESL